MAHKVFIIDTNVVVAGLLTSQLKSPTAWVLDSMLAGELIYLLSPELLREYHAVMHRPKLVALHKRTEAEIEQVLTEITANAIWREKLDRSQSVSPDLGDQHLWDLLACEANSVLLTGDKPLLQQPPSGRSVISPATLLAWRDASRR